MRKIRLAFILALSLLCSFSTYAEEGMIYPQPVEITAEGNEYYKLSFKGDLETNECWVWFVYSNEDDAKDLMGVMRDAIAAGTPECSLIFNHVLTKNHGTTNRPTVQVQAVSGYLFYGKAYRGVPRFDEEDDLFIMTLGGTNLSNIKPGEIGGNDLEDDAIIPPDTGDSTNPFLLAALLSVSSLCLVLLIKRSGKVLSIR